MTEKKKSFFPLFQRPKRTLTQKGLQVEQITAPNPPPLPAKKTANSVASPLSKQISSNTTLIYPSSTTSSFTNSLGSSRNAPHGVSSASSPRDTSSYVPLATIASSVASGDEASLTTSSSRKSTPLFSSFLSSRRSSIPKTFTPPNPSVMPPGAKDSIIWPGKTGSGSSSSSNSPRPALQLLTTTLLTPTHGSVSNLKGTTTPSNSFVDISTERSDPIPDAPKQSIYIHDAEAFARESVILGFDQKYTQWRNFMVRVLQQQQDCPLLINPDIMAMLEEDFLEGMPVE